MTISQVFCCKCYVEHSSDQFPFNYHAISSLASDAMTLLLGTADGAVLPSFEDAMDPVEESIVLPTSSSIDFPPETSLVTPPPSAMELPVEESMVSPPPPAHAVTDSPRTKSPAPALDQASPPTHGQDGTEVMANVPCQCHSVSATCTLSEPAAGAADQVRTWSPQAAALSENVFLPSPEAAHMPVCSE